MRRRLSRHWRVLIGLSVLVIFGLIASGYVIRTSRIDLSTGGVADWPYYGRDQEGTRYAPLDQINRGNVGYLEKTWEYHTGDFSDGPMAGRRPHFRPPRYSSTACCTSPRSTAA